MKKSELRNIIKEEILSELSQSQLYKISLEIADAGFLKIVKTGTDDFNQTYVTLKSSNPAPSWEALRTSGIGKFLPKRVIMKGPTSMADGRGITLEFIDNKLYVRGIPITVLKQVGIN